MVSSTLKQYTDSYNVNLSNYLNEYEDNTKAFFLQSEKANYQAYQNALTKISNQLQLFTREELNNNQNIKYGVYRMQARFMEIPGVEFCLKNQVKIQQAIVNQKPIIAKIIKKYSEI